MPAVPCLSGTPSVCIFSWLFLQVVILCHISTSVVKADQNSGQSKLTVGRVSRRGRRFFRSEPSEVSKGLRMRFLDRKTDGGRRKGKIAFYCSVLHISRQGFYCFLKYRNTPWKYEDIADKMRAVVTEDECNDTYGRSRMHDAPKLKYPEAKIPGERSVYRIMEGIGLRHRTQRKANGITKADKYASVKLL